MQEEAQLPLQLQRGGKERGITRGRGGEEGALSAELGWRARRAGGGGGACPPAGRRLRTCNQPGARESAGPACAGARCRRAAAEEHRGQAGAGAEFLQSLTWLPF